MSAQNQCFDLLALPKDVLGLIFDKLDLIAEMRSHQCIAKSWNEVYWSTLTSILMDTKTSIDIKDRQLIYALRRVNPLRVYSLDIFQQAEKLTLRSLSLLSQFVNLKSLRLKGVRSNLLSQTLTNLVSLQDIYLLSRDINEKCMNALADTLTNLTRILCATSNVLFRWQNAFKLTKLKDLTLAATSNFTTEGYSDIAKLSNLTLLNVDANKRVDNESLQSILSMTNLQALFFTCARATLPSAYSGLVKMTNLQILQGQILHDDETLSYLSQAYSLTSLEERNTDTDTPPIYCTSTQNFSYLVKLKSLQFQRILDSHEDDFEGIQFCYNLRSFDYSGSEITPQQFGYIAQIPQLESLEVTVPPTCADEISKLTHLTSLTLIKTDWFLEHLKKLTALTNLKYLRIYDNAVITEEQQSTIRNLFSPDIRTALTVVVYNNPDD